MLNGSLGRPTSVVAEIKDKEKRERFFFLHRGTYYLAVRLIKQNPLRQMILQIGPLVSTSANREGESPIRNSTAAEKVFGKKIDYYCEVNEKQEKASCPLSRSPVPRLKRRSWARSSTVSPPSLVSSPAP